MYSKSFLTYWTKSWLLFSAPSIKDLASRKKYVSIPIAYEEYGRISIGYNCDDINSADTNRVIQSLSSVRLGCTSVKNSTDHVLQPKHEFYYDRIDANFRFAAISKRGKNAPIAVRLSPNRLLWE